MESALKPGTRVDLVVRLDLVRGVCDVRPTLLLDLSARGHVLLAQPSPPLPARYKGKQMELTFLLRTRLGQWKRVGYRAALLGMVDGQAAKPPQQEEVLVFPPPLKLGDTTLRLHYRVMPPGDSGLALRLQPGGQAVSIVDMSAGGFLFSHPRSMDFPPGKEIGLLLEGPDTCMALEAVVVRSEDGPAGRGGPSFTAVRLINLDLAAERRILQLVTDIERQERARLSGME